MTARRPSSRPAASQQRPSPSQLRRGGPGARAAVAERPVATRRRRPAAASRPRSKARAFLPSRRSLAVGFALLGLAAAAYVAARQTSTFAVDRVEVAGAPPAVQAQVRRALAPILGTSLLALHGGSVERRVEALPTVVSAHYDRAFPHTLRLTVVAEKPVAVLHRGPDTWLLSARGRVMETVARRTLPGLPRIWVPHATPVAVGGFVAPDGAGAAARALALAAHFPARIATAATAHGELVFTLRSGLQVRLGAPTDVRLKLAIARRALRLLPAGAVYLDVSVPGRPVAGNDNPQVSGGA